MDLPKRAGSEHGSGPQGCGSISKSSVRDPILDPRVQHRLGLLDPDPDSTTDPGGKKFYLNFSFLFGLYFIQIRDPGTGIEIVFVLGFGIGKVGSGIREPG